MRRFLVLVLVFGCGLAVGMFVRAPSEQKRGPLNDADFAHPVSVVRPHVAGHSKHFTPYAYTVGDRRHVVGTAPADPADMWIVTLADGQVKIAVYEAKP